MSQEPIPVILDCDPGHDDAIALLLALASLELDLLGVTTTYGNQTLAKTTANALRILELVGRADVPVASGAAAPLEPGVARKSELGGARRRTANRPTMAARRKKRPLRPRVPSRVKRRKQRRTRSHHENELLGLALLALGLVFCAILYLGLDGGAVGSWLADALQQVLGSAAYVLPIVLLVLGGLMLARSALLEVRPFRLGVGVSFLGLMTLLGKDSGGWIGMAIGGTLAALIGETGAAIIGGALLLGGLLLVTGASTGAILRRTGHVVQRASSGAMRAFDWVSSESQTAEDVGLPPTLVPAPARGVLDGAEAYPDIVGEAPSGDPPPLIADGPEPEFESVETVFETSAEHSEYRLPDRTLLRSSPAVAASSGDPGARTADLLVRTLSEFGVDATVLGQISGPRVTRYELQLSPGTKVSKVAGLKDDLSYALATTEIRILAPIPGKQAVGVEVPNLSPRLVTLGDIYDDLPASASPLAVWLGKDISGNSVWTDLARMPHLLIAGTTGSGKSGCINTILTSTLLRATPDDVRMILIDPKRIELGYYESIPHLMTPVVSSPKEAAVVLMNVVAEMDRRYERLSFVRARSLPEANRALRARGEATLPYLLVVIDELADLMMISPQAVEDCVIRLAQKSRAVGIHLVLATQRPSVDVITGMIKANVPSRIAFAVSSQTDSRVILDTAGAESLLGQGDMLFKPLGTSRLQRLQGAYVTEEEVALVVEQCRSQRGQQLDESLLEAPEVAYEEGEEDGEFDPDEDPLLDRAIEIVVQTQTASVSLLQRRLRVGYTRAGRLIDMLERRGIISGYEGSKPRRVLVSEADVHTV
ncbi:MAG: DNA translocase FtsK 4TM domain-containing protein [Thermoleophilia bacterium]|nr:DNA translocase FtsK 4TM domain-containing protein [Thermoleophilia bacterium]MDH4340653.1 DNA translocase FtsK 4TM domain-containing protein [Thermoleophilia bacterium]